MQIHKLFVLILLVFFFNKIKEVDAKDRSVVKLTNDNFVILRGEINGLNSAKVINQLLKYQPGSQVYLYIISNGGSVTSGMEIVRAINTLVANNVDVKCIADTALSMGFVIFQYCPVRYVTSSSILMQHQISMGIHGPINQVTNYVSFIKTVEDELDTHQATRIGISVDEFHQKTGHDWWLFGKQLINSGAVDSMVDVICDFEIKKIKQSHQTIFGDVTVIYSSCPLARDPLQIKFNHEKYITPDSLNKILSKYDMTKYINNRLAGYIADDYYI